MKSFKIDISGGTRMYGEVSIKDTLDIKKAVTMDSLLLFVGITAMINGAVSLKDTLDIKKAVTMDSFICR